MIWNEAGQPVWAMQTEQRLDCDLAKDLALHQAEIAFKRCEEPEPFKAHSVYSHLGPGLPNTARCINLLNSCHLPSLD
jgi:hypothetical protein